MAEQQTKRPEQAGMGRLHGTGSGRHAMLLGQFQKPQSAPSTLRRLGGYLRQQPWRLAGVVGLVCAATGLGVFGPYLIGKAIDQYILARDFAGLTLLAGLMSGVYGLTSLMNWLQAYLMAAVSQRTVRDLRNDLFAKIQTLPLRFFDQRPHGEVMSRLTNDVENISNVLSDGVTQFIASLLTVAGVAAMMFWLNAWLALVSLVTVPLMGFLTKWVVAHTREGFREQQRTLGVLNGLIEETITGARVVKAYGREQAVIAAFEQANRDLRGAATGAQIFSLLLFPLTNFVNNTGFAIVAGVGGWMALRGLATVGLIASFLSYTRQFGYPLNQMATLYNGIQAALAGAERVFEILDEAPEAADAADAPALDELRGEVAFTDVCFGYAPDVPVLNQVSLHAQPGQMIALVGPTGAGKTTIVNVLTRFYDIDAGRITLDGQELRRVQRASLRRQLGIVLQDTFLFAAPVLENIRYGRLEATDAAVIAAAKLAEADHFIHRLPQGYATLLAERGSNLSQGQRQLLAIARAILADPGILILDEATSSVDTRTEAHLQQALRRLMAGRTSFVIAHRLSTIRNADQVLVINAGRIIERGTHAALLRARGFYYHLYLSQFKGQQGVLP